MLLLRYQKKRNKIFPTKITKIAFMYPEKCKQLNTKKAVIVISNVKKKLNAQV